MITRGWIISMRVTLEHHMFYRRESSYGISSGSHLCYRLSKPREHGAAGRIRYIELYSITSWRVEPAAFWLVTLRLNHLG
jgi:hypothetical protein